MTTTVPIARSDEQLMARARTAEMLIPPRPAEIRRLRGHVAGTVLSGIAAAVVRDVLLVLSELVANAVAASPRDQQVRVAVRATRSAVLVIVENQATIDPHALSFELPPPGALSGRGLAVVTSLTSEFDLRSRAGLTRARAVIPTLP